MAGKRSSWAALRMRRQALERDLQQRNSLRLHGALIGAFTLALTWACTVALRHAGVDSLALRYLLALGLGYAGYLYLLRWWAGRLLQSHANNKDSDTHLGDALDAVDVAADVADAASHLPWDRAAQALGRSTAQASNAADAASAAQDGSDAANSLGDLASGALDAVGSADEGAVVVVPVLALFALGAALFMGAGALALLFFGWDALLAVAVELAFASVAARTAMGLEREGWLGAALRLTCKPMLAALLCAAALGAAIDHWLPQAHTLPEAIKLLRSG